MNYYIVVEGISEKTVYKSWISFLNPGLVYVPTIFDIEENNFSIISGRGYPQYFDVIEAAIDDVNTHSDIDKFVISIDSEEMTYEDKLLEVTEFISDKSCVSPISLIIQHFCLETWALGNKRFIPRTPDRDSKVYEYRMFFDVITQDPELLPGFENLNRAQFAFKYLSSSAIIRGTSYNKRRPRAILNNSYLNQVSERYNTDNHIKSFKNFLEAFSS